MELMVTVVVIEILSSMILQNYYQHITRTRQNEASITIAQMQINIEADIDAASQANSLKLILPLKT